MEGFGHIIDGREEADGATFDSVDPWTREPWATVALGGAAEADRARHGGAQGVRRGSVAADGLRRAR